MDWDPPGAWDHLAGWLRSLPSTLPSRPRALLVISAHWEESLPTVTTASQPEQIYDYHGFPPHTYQLRWPAPGDPALAAKVRNLLSAAGIASGESRVRDFDHGVFVPLLLAFPEADVPTVQLSLTTDLDAARHLAIGRALGSLCEEGVLIIGSGFSYHNLRAMVGHAVPDVSGSSRRFDEWLSSVAVLGAAQREVQLARWANAPDARACHPRAEHLMPLMVAAGASPYPGIRAYHHELLDAVTHSGYRFG